MVEAATQPQPKDLDINDFTRIGLEGWNPHNRKLDLAALPEKSRERIIANDPNYSLHLAIIESNLTEVRPDIGIGPQKLQEMASEFEKTIEPFKNEWWFKSEGYPIQQAVITWLKEYAETTQPISSSVVPPPTPVVGKESLVTDTANKTENSRAPAPDDGTSVPTAVDQGGDVPQARVAQIETTRPVSPLEQKTWEDLTPEQKAERVGQQILQIIGDYEYENNKDAKHAIREILGGISINNVLLKHLANEIPAANLIKSIEDKDKRVELINLFCSPELGGKDIDYLMYLLRDTKASELPFEDGEVYGLVKSLFNRDDIGLYARYSASRSILEDYQKGNFSILKREEHQTYSIELGDIFINGISKISQGSQIDYHYLQRYVDLLCNAGYKDRLLQDQGLTKKLTQAGIILPEIVGTKEQEPPVVNDATEQVTTEEKNIPNISHPFSLGLKTGVTAEQLAKILNKLQKPETGDARAGVK